VVLRVLEVFSVEGLCVVGLSRVCLAVVRLSDLVVCSCFSVL